MAEKLYAKNYVHINSIGKVEEGEIICHEMKSIFSNLYKNKLIEGYIISFIKNKEEAIEEIYFSDFNEITKGVFPFIYAAPQPYNLDHFNLEVFMENLNFVSFDLETLL